MDSNELIRGKKWWARRKWALIAVIVVFALIVVFFIGGLSTFGSLGRAYADKPVFDKAVAMAQQDSVVKAEVGEIAVLDKVAIAEGTANYSKNGDTLNGTITVKGSIKKAKLDIIANRSKAKWIYTTLKIRINDPKQEIDVLANR